MKISRGCGNCFRSLISLLFHSLTFCPQGETDSPQSHPELPFLKTSLNSSDTNLTSVVYKFVGEDTYSCSGRDMYPSLQAELICLLLMSNRYYVSKANDLGALYPACAGGDGGKVYFYRFSLLEEMIEKHPGTKWADRAMVQLVWNEFGKCDENKYECDTFIKIIKVLPPFLVKVKDKKAKCDLYFQLGAAYETCYGILKDTDAIDYKTTYQLPSKEEARLEAIKCFKKALSLDKNGYYKNRVGQCLPKLYLDIPTGSYQFFRYVD